MLLPCKKIPNTRLSDSYLGFVRIFLEKWVGPTVTNALYDDEEDGIDDDDDHTTTKMAQ